MLWIGLTGGLASGKSSVAEELKRFGFPVISADEVAHQALRPDSSVAERIMNHFGTLNRSDLGKKVFGNPEQLRILESLVHPFVQERVRAMRADLAAEGHPAAFYDVPLLFEKNLQAQFDKVIVVSLPVEEQKRRARARNNWSEAEVVARLAAQLPLSEKVRLADVVIDNSGTRADLVVRVQAALQTLGLKV